MVYFYKAKNLQGLEEAGYLEARDKKELAQALKARGYFLLFAQVKENKKTDFLARLDFLKGIFGVSATEKLFFTRNLEVMVRTGISLPRAFEILSKQTKNKKFKKALEEISGKIIKGESLSACLKSFPGIFSPLYQETIRIGEETGKLEGSLKILETQIEREHALKSKIKTAMVYPGIILCMAFLIGALMVIFAIPKLKDAFVELKITLPLSTRIILGFSDFLVKKWYLTAVFFAFFSGLVFFLLKVGRGGKFKSTLILKVPVLSSIIKKTNSALTLRTLSSLLKAGVPVVKSLEIASGAINNYYFKKSLKEASLLVERGEKISESLDPYQHLYSPMVLQMMRIGEETGETSEILEKLADFYDEEVTASTERLSTLIEPFLIALIGAVVGFVAISVIQPMFSIMGGI